MHCDMAYIGGRYDPFHRVKKAVLGLERVVSGAEKNCTARPIGLISLISPVTYNCTLIFRVFAARCFLFSNSRNLRGQTRHVFNKCECALTKRPPLPPAPACSGGGPGENAVAGLRPVVSEPAPRNRHTLWHKMHPDGIKITIRDIWNRQRLIYC